ARRSEAGPPWARRSPGAAAALESAGSAARTAPCRRRHAALAATPTNRPANGAGRTAPADAGVSRGGGHLWETGAPAPPALGRTPCTIPTPSPNGTPRSARPTGAGGVPSGSLTAAATTAAVATTPPPAGPSII